LSPINAVPIKGQLELEKLQIEVQLIKAKSELELEKLRAEILILKNKSPKDIEKIDAEIRDLKRHYLFRNMAPVATILAAIIGICGTIGLNSLAAERENIRRINENLTKKILVNFKRKSSSARISAAYQFSALDPEIGYYVLDNAIETSNNCNNKSLIGNIKNKALEMDDLIRVGVMEAAGISGLASENKNWLSKERKRSLLVRGLEDCVPLVRHKALIGLASIDQSIDIQDYYNKSIKNQPTSEKHNGYIMQRIKEDYFVIGSDQDQENEKPAQQIKYNYFLIDKNPVTNSQWNSVMGVAPDFKYGNITKWTRMSENKDKPVLGVNFIQATEFCKKTGRTGVPTEIEWEISARGSSGFIFPWGMETHINNQIIKRQENYKNNHQPNYENIDMDLVEWNENDISIFGLNGMSSSHMEWVDSEYKEKMDFPYAKNTPCQKFCTLKGAAAMEQGDLRELLIKTTSSSAAA
jgi:formylglycine-generating enzyme required for sulfatase activity